MNYKEIEKVLKEMLPERRLEHSLNVSKCAVKLSEVYKCDKEKAEIAGLVHDCAKYFTDEQIEDCVRKFNIELDPIEVNNIALSHSVIGSYVAKEVFNIDDEEIITLGRVVRVECDKDGKYICGLIFLTIEKNEREKLIGYIFNEMRKTLKTNRGDGRE